MDTGFADGSMIIGLSYKHATAKGGSTGMHSGGMFPGKKFKCIVTRSLKITPYSSR